MQELFVGDRAPPLKAFDLRTNEPLEDFVPGMLYVVEFWATWCGPCRRAIPHVSEMQAKYSGATIIAVAVREESRATVEAFVADQGSAISYRVAVDTDIELPGNNEGWCYLNWCKAAFRSGIPASFIVDRSGRIAWIGHPLTLDQPLSAIEAGAWDLDAQAKAYRESFEANHVREMFTLHAATAAWMRDGDASAALAIFDDIFSGCPQVESKMGPDKLSILLTSDHERAMEYARHLCMKVGPADEDLLFKVSTSLMESVQQKIQRGEPVDEASLLIAEDALARAASSLKELDSARDHMMIERQLARLHLLANRREVAARHVRSATAFALEAKAAPQIIEDLQALEAKCLEV